jgi:hypothetical protein
MWRSSLVFAMLIATVPAPASADEPAKPTFAPIVEKPAFQFTKCALWCWAARDVVGPSTSSVVVVLRRVPTAEEIEPADERLALQSGQDDDVRTLPGTFEKRASAATQDRVTVDPKLSALPPGHYSGSLVFDVSSGADPVAVPVELDVRLGPELPLVVLIGSVFLGALMGWGLSQQPKVKFKKSAEALRDRIAGVPDREKRVLLPLWQNIWDGRGDADVRDKLPSLEQGATALASCRNAEDSALTSPYASDLTPWIQRIADAVDGVFQAVRSLESDYDKPLGLVTGAADEFKEAADALGTLRDREALALPAASAPEYPAFAKAAGDVRKALADVSPDPTEDAPSLRPLMAELEVKFKALEASHGSALEEALDQGGPVSSGTGVATALATVRGLVAWPAAAVSAPSVMRSQRGPAAEFDVAAWFGAVLAPVAALVVAIVLLAVGFKVTYLDDATFGATFTDWVALFIWGVAAWGARATLTGLAPSGEAKKE